MPVYLVHGFRWPRGGFTGIRVHIIIHNLDDCSAEYIQNPHSQAELLKSFRHAYPELMKELELPALSGEGKVLQFLEQYDPEDELGENAASQPFAFVGDKVVTIAGGPAAPFGSRNSMESATVTSPASTAAVAEPVTPAFAGRSGKGSAGVGMEAAAGVKAQALSLNVEEVVAEGPGVAAAAWEAFADLRDKIAPGEKIGWWVVYNGDPERAYESYDDDDDDSGEKEEDEKSYVEEGEEDATAKNGDAKPSLRMAPKPSPTAPLAEKALPPQPTPKPRISEQQDPDQGDPTRFPLSPLRSSTAKSSGKRLPGMKIALQPKQPQHQSQQQQQQQCPQRPHGTESTKPRAAPKSESLKKRLFGKRT